MKAFSTLFVSLFLGVLLMGCETIGSGLTNRQFDTAWEALDAGLTPEIAIARLGEPREKRPAATTAPMT